MNLDQFCETICASTNYSFALVSSDLATDSIFKSGIKVRFDIACMFDRTLYRCNQYVKVNIVWQSAECMAGVSFPRTYLARTRPARAGKKRVRERTNITSV